jgi:probable HAF family extracellular repeat protein
MNHAGLPFRAAVSSWVVASVVALALASPRASAQTFQPLGPVDFGPGYKTIFPRGLSADGAIVAGSSLDGNGISEAIRWQDGTFTGLGYLPGAPASAQSEATSISADGNVIVGFSSVSLSPQGNNRTEPFRIVGNGPMTSLGRLPNTRDRLTQATDVSGDGGVVVGWDQRAPTGISAWRWTSGGGMTQLGPLPGSTIGAVARAVTTDGLTVIGDGDTGASDNVAWRWRAGNIENLGDLPGGNVDATPFALSADGNVIAGRGHVTAPGFGNRYEAFRWQGGAFIGLGDLPGGDFTSEAYGITADGNTIVGFSADGSDQERGAFIWDAAHGMRDLRTVLINDYGLTQLTGWNLDVAYAISPDGTTIIGDGLTPTGAFQGWIVRIPEPTASAAATLAVLVLIRRKR